MYVGWAGTLASPLSPACQDGPLPVQITMMALTTVRRALTLGFDLARTALMVEFDFLKWLEMVKCKFTWPKRGLVCYWFKVGPGNTRC